ncbi:LamG domain-containing protein, partial [Acidocella sp.]|uniref:LamG domain-containing protein n=1 Tax=Acidocella sp. TaxID=50710 RepID=UPI00262C13A1
MSVVLLLPLSALAAPSAAPTVLETPSAGLVSWWPGNGTANDFMGVNNGTLQGTATFAAGHAGQAFSLNGSGLVSVPDSTTLHISQFSISAWFNWNDLGTNTTQFLLGKGLEHFEIELDSTATTNNVRFIPAGYPATFVDAANAIQPGWNHVVVTYSGSDANVYVNGSLAANRTGIAGGADLTADGSPLTIGRRGDWAYPFRGLIDDVALYNRVLSATEVAALYSGGTLRSAAVAGNGGVATLYGTVNDNGSDTTVTFEYGATTAYGSTAAATPAPVTAGSGPAMVSGSTTGLAACGTTYHYRIKAVNANGATYGADQTLGLRQCQTITFGASPVLVAGGGGTVTATSNSGLPVTLSTTTPAVCSVSGATVTAKIAGTCTVIATQAGNGVYAPASQTLNLTVGPGNQNISFGTAPVIGVGGTGTVSATSSSGLAVSFSSTTPGICTVSGATVTGVAAGTCAITASQAGNANIPAAQSSQSFTITPVGSPIIGTLKPTGLVANGAPSTVTYNFNPRLSFPTRGTLNGLVNP